MSRNVNRKPSYPKPTEGRKRTSKTFFEWMKACNPSNAIWDYEKKYSQ